MDCLAFLVQIDVRDVASIERQVLLTHCVRIKCLIHAGGWLPWSNASTRSALGLWLLARSACHLLRELAVGGTCHATRGLHHNSTCVLRWMKHALVLRGTIVLLIDQVDLNHMIFQHFALLLALLLLLFHALLEECLFEKLVNSLLLHIGDTGTIACRASIRITRREIPASLWL